MARERTIATLDELDRAEWFSMTGKRSSQLAVFLRTWNDAVDHCVSENWRTLCEEAANQYRSRLAEKDITRFREWNAIVREVKPLVQPLVLRKTRAIIEQESLPDGFLNVVQWDILHLCMEAEFADVFQPGFYAAQGYWYSHGHFPCGWEGEFPTGRPIVF